VNESGHWNVVDLRLLDDDVEALQLVDSINSSLVSVQAHLETAKRDVDAA
jgi:hypothetical protein